MADPADLQARLKALNDDYAARLPARLNEIRQAWNRLPQDGWDEEGLLLLHRLVHSLTGSGKTFGFALLSDVARSLEEYLKQLVLDRKAPDAEQRKHIQVLLGELQQVAIQKDDQNVNP